MAPQGSICIAPMPAPEWLDGLQMKLECRSLPTNARAGDHGLRKMADRIRARSLGHNNRVLVMVESPSHRAYGFAADRASPCHLSRLGPLDQGGGWLRPLLFPPVDPAILPG
jgi:hypothetical protein